MIQGALESYETETRALARITSTTEETFYPLIRQLIAAAIIELELPFDVRTGTSEFRPGKGRDRPDIVVADGSTVAAYGEVKGPDDDLARLALSTERNDQIGRYLARTGVVLICNVRQFGLLLCRPGVNRGSVDRISPSDRELVRVVPLWTRDTSISSKEAGCGFLELVERALLDNAPIGEPATLARILALQAKAAKNDLPPDLNGLETLLEDYRDALGLSFNLDEHEGREFFRSTLIQTAFYGLFAAWALWQREEDEATFSWDRVNWPAAGFVDTEIRCLTELESGNAKKEVQPRVQA